MVFDIILLTISLFHSLGKLHGGGGGLGPYFIPANDLEKKLDFEKINFCD